MVLATNLGFPRVGTNRELKKATEAYWKGSISADELQESARNLRLHHWKMQKDAGIDHIPSNDFSFYDQILDMICTLGCVPARYNWSGDTVPLDTYFAMARGRQTGDQDVTAMEMTKWFDTNYHYIVPEFEENQSFKLSSTKIFDEYREAKEAGIETRPVLIGPMSFIRLGKYNTEEKDPKALLQALLPVYQEILQKLEEAGAEWVQIDEPFLVMNLCEEAAGALNGCYEALTQAAPNLKILVATYFEGLHNNMKLVFGLPVQAVHLDLSRAPDQFDAALAAVPENMMLSLGLVDGRNIWRNDLDASLGLAEKAVAQLGAERVMIAPSCSMLHTPFDLALETELDEELKGWLAFSRQKLDEIVAIAKGANEGRDAIGSPLALSNKSMESRRSSDRIHNAAVKERINAITPEMMQRQSPFPERQKLQREKFNLPIYPTTTIGSFPQTQEIRKARAAFKKGDMDRQSYEDVMKKEIRNAVKFQEETGLDVFVHGEPERNDMVEYFGEQLSGFAFTKNGWVQSYGSRCVKPPVIFGDISRPEPMTVSWSEYAQSLTEKPMKGMLTGPITILCWSFVRDDQPRSETTRQIALALRDEVVDLEKAGIGIIQIDEPAIREGMPLRRADWDEYLKWAVECFRLTSCGVEDTTQIHTHMCYSEFNDMIDSIGDLDADVISIEASRSRMDLLTSFVEYKYPNEIGPGVYDIHSPRIPTVAEITDLLEKAEKVLSADQLWVNPDCGLKTRAWPDVEGALKNMVESAKMMREKRKSAAA